MQEILSKLVEQAVMQITEFLTIENEEGNDNGDSLPYPYVTKEQLDEELDKMRKRFNDGFDYKLAKTKLKANFQKEKKAESKESECKDRYLAKINKEDELVALRVKQRQMKIGEAWQELISCQNGFKNIGKTSGIDIHDTNTNTYFEIKNRYNTDNSKSKKSVYDQMVDILSNDPTATCVYGIINDRTSEGKHTQIKYRGYTIEIYTGECLLDFIFGTEKDKIIKFMEKMVDKYMK
jgi:Eco47II restriction endonuclease